MATSSSGVRGTLGLVVVRYGGFQDGTGGTEMARERWRFTPEFKARVALEALREHDSVQAIATRHELHPNQVSTWKRLLLEGLPKVFAGGAGRKATREHEAKLR